MPFFNVDAENFKEEVLLSDKIIVVDFWHKLCAYCLMLNPGFEEISKRRGNHVKFVKINIRESLQNQRLAESCGVLSTPTLKFFYRGKEIGELIGFFPKDELRKEAERIIKRAEDCAKSSTTIVK